MSSAGGVEEAEDAADDDDDDDDDVRLSLTKVRTLARPPMGRVRDSG